MYSLNKMILMIFLCLCLFCSKTVAALPETTLETSSVNLKEFRCGWINLEPYQYIKEEDGVKILTGLNIELLKVITKELGIKLKYEKTTWDKLLKDIESGTMDIATGALFSEKRAEYAYYSLPYRFEEDSLFVRKEVAKKITGTSAKELLLSLKKNNLKLGVIKAFNYADPLINDYINDPTNQPNIVRTNSDYENLDLLQTKEIDGFIADRIVGSTVIWRMHAGKNIAEYPLQLQRPIYFIFSKKSVSPNLVTQFNEAIESLKDSAEYQKIVSWYVYPVIFLQIEDAEWFKITEIIGIVAFAISGLIIAFKEKATLFGALILAILPSLGGGLMRDVIFGRNPVGALQSPIYLSAVLLTVLTGFIVIKLLTHFRRHFEIPGEIEDLIRKRARHILIITDAIGLAMFTVTGVMITLLAKIEPLWLWGPFFAFLTGAGGGILRDMLSKSRYIAALEGELYGEIAIFWGFFLSIFILINAQNIQPENIQMGVMITILGAFLTRILAHFIRVPNARFGQEN